MSDYFRHHFNVIIPRERESWGAASPLTLRIKEKIESKGKPLKDWAIDIYRGILTGYNEAFIVNQETRDRLVSASPNCAEIIRPILRGRDIEKYNANWGGSYLIVSHTGYTNPRNQKIEPIDINDYPAVKKHLNQYWEQIRDRQDQGLTPYNLRSCIYMDDFFKHKIMYPNMTKYMPFIFDTEGYFINDKGFIITGEGIAFLTAFLNSSLFKFCFRENFPELQGGTRELRKVFLDKIPVIQVSNKVDQDFKKMVVEIQTLKRKGVPTIDLEKKLDSMIFDLYDLTNEERTSIGFIEIT